MKDILIVGSVALDDLETPAGKRDACLGGSATYFSASASLFAPIKLVGVVGTDFPPEHIEALSKRDIDLTGLEQVEGETFRWGGRYGADLGDPVTLRTDLNVFERFDPKIPEGHRRAPLVFLGNIHPSLQLKVIDQLEGNELIGADTMNLWIDTTREALLELLKRVDLLVINQLEARMLSGEDNVYLAAEQIQEMGPKYLIIKRGAYGALLFHPEGLYSAPAYPLKRVIDPTGAGDTFASGFMGHLAKHGDLSFKGMKRAVLSGTVMASFACEGFGLERPLSLTFEEVEARLSALRAMVDLG
ncbi:bifunctional hydroxymethylpyrimidine kinase/phosphomethylpyrimidine kinase [Myxococcota bacterium]|nr:bifunctional hydroxymethylpyrimidine kinase/phosphomethylpyrimidine kinase [Myxococcota bacterium]MBU1431273.1 bifunctional hydroxymethylpyrimidine kinase/phosphomethylpyrimidine kinase [Myxococcota bacterium]MBU1900463.1 bifunctional hydroxymethylpyrimidine kinase/phosphomethylpyrimidine kinase [Myxococcota bacterium]